MDRKGTHKMAAIKEPEGPKLGSPEWIISMKDRIISAQDMRIKAQDDTIAALQERKDLLIASTGTLEAQIEDYKYRIAEMEASSRPVRKRASKPHSFQLITGGLSKHQ